MQGAVRIRPVAMADAAPLAQAYARNRSYLQPWEPVRPDSFFTADGQQPLLAAAIAEAASGRSFHWLMVEDGDIAGRISLNDVVRGAFRNAHVGYWVAADRQGKGLATAALNMVVELARDTLGLHRLQAGTLTSNLGSQAVLSRNGFTPIGLAEKYLRINGEWQDHLLFQRILDSGHTPAP